METSPSILPDDVDALRAIIAAQADQLAEQARKLQSRDTLIDKLKAQLAVLKRARFGSSSEKMDRAIEQLELALEDIEAAEAEEAGHACLAPMVGTFYSAPTPGSPPFVQVGDRVSEGDTLCIVEAMKMMNQIEAETNGTIKSIRAQNGEPVEYEQILFVIDQRDAD